jgi:hypothetical protein
MMAVESRLGAVVASLVAAIITLSELRWVEVGAPATLPESRHDLRENPH